MARLNYVKSFRGTSKTADGNLTCGRCSTKIKKGDPYQWWANRSPGMRSGYKQVRCMNCTPTLAERTPGRAGQLMGIQDNVSKTLADIGSTATESGDFETVAQDAAQEIRELGEELRESAQNIEDGFGHPTYQSEELEQRADNIDSQCDDIEQCDIDEPPSEDEIDDDELDEGLEGEDRDQARQELFQEKLQEWRDEQVQKIEDAVNEVDIYG